MLPWSMPFAGRIEERQIESVLLDGNPLNDPAERPLWVYVPPRYDDDPYRRYPTVFVLQGFTGTVAMWRNRSPFRQPFPELVDVMFEVGDAPPAIVVYVDAWTAYGGSQFLDSPATGRYHSYLCDEVVPWVDANYRTLASREHRAISGKSSGGYGAMVTPMLRPDLFGAFATHAGDALFEACYAPDFPWVARTLRDQYDGDYQAFLGDFGNRVAFTKESDAKLIEMYAYAAAYSAADSGVVQLPFDVATGRLHDDVWERWLAWDPVRMAVRHRDALRSMRAIWIDAGTRDEWYLDLAAEAFRRELNAAGVSDDRVHFELFDAKHGGIEYRYPLALAWLLDRISP